MPSEKEIRDRTSSDRNVATEVNTNDNITTNDKAYRNDTDQESSHDVDVETGRRLDHFGSPPLTPTGMTSQDGLEMLAREGTHESRKSISLGHEEQRKLSQQINSTSNGATISEKKQETASSPDHPHEDSDLDHDNTSLSSTTSHEDHIAPIRTHSRATTADPTTGTAAPVAAINSIIDIPDTFYDRLTPRRKIFLVSFCSFCAFLSPISSTASLAALPEMAAEYNTTGSIINISNSLYLLFMGFAPLVWGPMSQVFGRRMITIVVAWGFLLSSIGSALAPELVSFFVFRITTAMFSTGFILAGNAVVADIYRPVERGTATGFLLIGMLVGPAFGPFLGGVIVTYRSWRVIFWLQTALAGVALLGSYLVLPETIFHKKWDDLAGYSGKQRTKVLWGMCNPWRVIRLWRYPNVLLAGLVSSSLLWNMYGLLAPIRYVLNPRYGLTTPLLGGLFYLAPGLGYLAGSFVGGRWADYTVKKWIKKRNGERIAEDRLRSALPFLLVVAATVLVYGWTIEMNVGGIPLTVVILFLQGVAQLFCFPSLNTYCLDVMPGRSAELIGSNYAMRYFGATISIAVVLPAIEAIGVGWYSTISCLLIVASAGGTWYNIKYGKAMREKLDEKIRLEQEKSAERKLRKHDHDEQHSDESRMGQQTNVSAVSKTG